MQRPTNHRNRCGPPARSVELNVRSLDVKPIIRAIIAGAIWAILPAMIFRWAPWYAVGGVLLSGPAVGWAVFVVSRWAYGSRMLTVLWTVPSVYFAAAITSLVIGLLDSIARGGEMVMESVVATLWGISIPSPLWLIYPLALATHLWVSRGRSVGRELNGLNNAI